MVRSAAGAHLAAKIGAGVAALVAVLVLSGVSAAAAEPPVPILPGPIVTPPVGVTLPGVKVALPPVTVAAPPVKVALPPVTVALPPVSVAVPPVKVALPPVNISTPPVKVALPPARVAPPPVNVGLPGPVVALPPVNVVSPPGGAALAPTGSTPAGSPAAAGPPAGEPLADPPHSDAGPGAVASVNRVSGSPASGAVVIRDAARDRPSRHDRDASREARAHETDLPSGFLTGGAFGVNYSVVSVAELVAILVAFVAVGFLVTRVLATLRARGTETSLRRAPGSS
jgi:hypothetical protein